MPREAATLIHLGEVDDLMRSTVNVTKYYHVFGILRQEVSISTTNTFWEIFDENREIKVKLSGQSTEYPRPKPGDIIRIHRLRVNPELGNAEVVAPRNVVVWPAYQHDPKPLSMAKNPTISEDDTKRRRILEAYFCTRIGKLRDTRTDQFSNIVGRIEGSSIDPFGHLEIPITDGTDTITLRVFCKKENHDDDIHFQTASGLVKGQFLVATNVKYNIKKRTLDLSANTKSGKSLRKVEEASILGAKLNEALDVIPVSVNQENTSSSSSGSQIRRSSRLLRQHNDENGVKQQQEPANASDLNGSGSSTSRQSVPNFTALSDIQRKDKGYDFYDLVGQVRGKPCIVPNQFNNCFVQIFDGTLHPFANHFAPEVDNPIDGCLVICVYSKQQPWDTDEHINKAIRLKEGDIVHIKNVKVSFVDGKIRAELSANHLHNKGIDVIDKRTAFGKTILHMAETPQVAELRDIIDPGTDCPFSDLDDELSS